MKKFLLICALLAGCGTLKPPAVVRVEVPISIPCTVRQLPPPPFAVDTLTYDSDIWDMMAALRAERIQRQAYEKLLEAAIAACR